MAIILITLNQKKSPTFQGPITLAFGLFIRFLEPYMCSWLFVLFSGAQREKSLYYQVLKNHWIIWASIEQMSFFELLKASFWTWSEPLLDQFWIPWSWLDAFETFYSRFSFFIFHPQSETFQETINVGKRNNGNESKLLS